MPYAFNVDEGKANAYVGMVHAHDADEGINAQVSYFLPDDVPFTINTSNGEIRTKNALDYETHSSYKFVVTAKDGAAEPRHGTATVMVSFFKFINRDPVKNNNIFLKSQISVNDVPDEVPKFTDTLIEVKAPENIPNYRLTTVKAFDADTIKQITYTLRSGRNDLFKVDAKSGEVKTISNLDYEEAVRHELIVGTLENESAEDGATVKIVVNVEDRNDVAPVFVALPEPVTVNDDDPIGTEIAEMSAHDGDGSYPGNEVRYEIVGRGKALLYFQIDAEKAIVRIKEDLRKEPDSEYHIDVRAYDLGEPQLSTTTSLIVFVRHFLLDEDSVDVASNHTIHHHYAKPVGTMDGDMMRTEILDGKSNEFLFFLDPN